MRNSPFLLGWHTRFLLRYTVPIAALLTVLGTGCEHAQPPNIVFILIDDLGWADLPAYGHAFHETPNIDRLASQGMLFTQAYAAAPVCSPTRASIQSGQYPARIGITDFITGHWRPYERLMVPLNRTQHLPLEVETVAEVLLERNYATAYFGKWHLGNPRVTPALQGYEHGFYRRGGGHIDVGAFLVPPQDVDSTAFLSDIIADHGINFMEDHIDQPFFLVMSHYAVHIPLQSTKQLIDKYEQKPRPDTGLNNPVYAAMIEQVDQSVGRVMEQLDKLGIADHTVVVLTSDNGGLLERFDRSTGVKVTTNTPLRDEKGSLYEGGIRVPMIVRWPAAVDAGTTTDAVVSSVDFYPTFVDLAGGSMPVAQEYDGISMVPVLSGNLPETERAIFFHYPHYHHSTPAGAIRVGDYKLIEFFEDGRAELYNLRSDPSESQNLVEELPERAAGMQQSLTAWRTEIGALMPTRNPNFDESRRHEWGRHPDRQ